MTTTTPLLEAAAAGAVSRTRVRVERAAHGRVRVCLDAVGASDRPLLRPMLLSSTARSARVCLVPEGALLLADDAIEVDVDIGPGVRLELVEPAGTVAYDMRGRSARWDVRVRLGQDAALVWGGEPFVIASGAHVTRTTGIELAVGARLALRETVVAGRHGERPGTLHSRLSVTGPDLSPILVDDLALGAASARPGVLGAHRVLCSVLALGVEIAPETVTEDRFDLESGGTLWRRLGEDAHTTTLSEAWRATARTVTTSCPG